MSRHVTSCHVMLRHVTSCHVMSRHATSRSVTSCHVMSRHVMLRRGTSCHVESLGTVTRPTLHCQLTFSTRNSFELSMTVFVGCPEGCRFHTALAVYDLVFSPYRLLCMFVMGQCCLIQRINKKNIYIIVGSYFHSQDGAK